MVIAAIAAFVGVSILVVVAMAALHARARSERRLAAVLGQLDDHMKAVSQSLQSAIERSADVRKRAVGEIALTLDLDQLLQRLVTEAARLTGADAVAVRVRGPGGAPVVASSGTEHGARMLTAVHAPPDARPFRALAMSWTYGPGLEREAESAFRSALVVPIVEDGVESGALAVYARPAGAFLPEQVHALGALAEEAATGIVNARRFAEVELRAVTDVVTGVPNRRGYEVELEREVARAGRTGRPLSLVVLDLDYEATSARFTPPRDDAVLQEFAGLLARVTRATDIVCRRGEMQFGVLLPETTASQARHLYLRLREQAAGTAFTSATGPMTFTVGLVEWRQSETGDSLDARASAAVGQTAPDTLELLPDRIASRLGDGRISPSEPALASQDSPSELVTARTFRERLAREVAGARSFGQPLALLLVDVGDLPSVDDRLDQTAADRVLADLATRISQSAQADEASSRLGTSVLAVILPRSTVADAESIFAALQGSLEKRPSEDVDRIVLSAGITELAAGDDLDTVLGRANQALWQAKQAGTGTVVVATVDTDVKR